MKSTTPTRMRKMFLILLRQLGKDHMKQIPDAAFLRCFWCLYCMVRLVPICSSQLGTWVQPWKCLSGTRILYLWSKIMFHCMQLQRKRCFQWLDDAGQHSYRRARSKNKTQTSDFKVTIFTLDSGASLSLI